ncbi:arylacetamide deacetylase-like 2 [Tupaia chinensis]|uniref:arylacetamide deacetylase-like 2 n=1 Tax=Tupaia chinensis TaxID=246437 RepID=UPI0003C8CB04|nr:arylacetamide deacetylase-like 2 [Tupaia chinensis]
MAYKALCLGLMCSLFVYQIYTPIPEDIEEPWKVTMLNVLVRTTELTGTLLEKIGLMKSEELFSRAAQAYFTKPISDENVTVIDTAFNGIPVRLYLPKKKSERKRPAVIFIHGGAFVLGSCKHMAYDIVHRQMVNQLGAVVLGVDYRLAPEYQYPIPLEDSISVTRFFLQDKILAKYEVDPTRICISGDSSGGMFTAIVTQVLKDDPEFKNKIKAQVLIYPSLQSVDLSMPSYQENEYGLILTKEMAVKYACLYITNDEALLQAARKNQHMPQGSRHLFKFVNWSTLLPEKYRKNHVYKEPVLGKLNSFPGLLDTRLSPLIANDSQLQNLPLTYIITCGHDVLRDDGLIYVTRLRSVGVKVVHEHMENAFHGALSFITPPFYLHLGFKMKDMYINWLEKNL